MSHPSFGTATAAGRRKTEITRHIATSSASAASPTRMQDLGHDQEHIHEHQHDQEDLTPHMIAKLSFQEVVI